MGEGTGLDTAISQQIMEQHHGEFNVKSKSGVGKGQIYQYLPKPIRTNLLQLSLERAFEQYQKMVDSPPLTQRYEVEEDDAEVTQATISSKIKGFISRLPLKFG